MNTVIEQNGMLVCGCGAKATNKSDFKRFARRHPAICSKLEKEKQEKIAFTHKIAQGTRSVGPDIKADSSPLELLDAINKNATALTTWEEKFLLSVNKALIEVGPGALTTQMVHKIREIYKQRVNL